MLIIPSACPGCAVGTQGAERDDAERPYRAAAFALTGRHLAIMVVVTGPNLANRNLVSIIFGCFWVACFMPCVLRNGLING